MIKQIITTLLLGGLLSSCALFNKKSNAVDKVKEPPLDEYWILKRSHPVFGYDHEAYKKGMNEINKLRLAKTGGPSTNLPWQLEGPFEIGGRVNVLTPLHRTSDTIFAGTANGGVFRTVDGGAYWTPLFDDIPEKAIGAITIHPTNPSIVYVGTGDRKFGGHSFIGNGIYKSDDYGDSWTNIGLNDVGIISAIIINEQNPDEIVVGALGSGFEKTTDRGIFKSTDGGASWTNTLFISDSSGVTEMAVHPTNPDILYAASFNRVNLPDHSIAKGPDAKLWKSIDGGSSWTQMTNGLPTTDMSRVGITISESNPNKLYAVYVNTNYQLDEVYVSNDAGNSWSALNAGPALTDLCGGFGWYFGTIFVNPYNENHVIVQGVEQFESTDGGATWTMNVPDWWTYEVHADKHALYFQDSTTMLIGTDGSIYKTSNLGVNWSPLGSLPITQFYRVNANTFTNGRYAGGCQDNGTTSGNASGSWTRDFGGDGFKVSYLDPTLNSVIYETQRGGLYFVDNNWGTSDFSIDIDLPGENVGWETPYVVLPGNVVVAGSNRILMHVDPQFDNWMIESTDLTMTSMGATTHGRYHVISELDYNPFDTDDILVGTSDGLVWRGMIGSNNWNNITANLPTKYVSSVKFSKRTQNKMYATLTGYYNNFYQALVFKSEDGGQTWTDISSNLPAIGINDMITYDIDNMEALFLATDGGVFMSLNDGQSWELLGTDLPLVAVTSLDINAASEVLIAGTYGRSMWSYDLTWTLNAAELDQELNFITYPNPTEGSISINKATDELIILNALGAVVFTARDVQKGETLDISELPAGTYLIRVGSSSRPIIIH